MSDLFVIFTGRPNAGKSTVIRALTGLKISVGKRPGTTTKINKYQIANGLFLVDMPGYGRKIDANKRWEDETKNQILNFIERNSESIIAAVHVLNITTFIETDERLSKKGFMSLDVEMVKYLDEILGEFPFVAANKIDKGKELDVVNNLEAFTIQVTDGDISLGKDYVFPVSAKKGIGMGDLKNRLVQKLVKNGFSNPFEYIR